MLEPVLQILHHLVNRKTLSGAPIQAIFQRHDTPSCPRHVTDLAPAPRPAVAHIVDRTGLSVFQRDETDRCQVLDMDQIDVSLRWSDLSSADPIQHIASWSVNAGRA